MFQDYAICPRCEQTLGSERRSELVVVCDCCGFVISNAEQKTTETSQRSFVKVGVGLFALMVCVFAQIAVWDGHAIEVIPLKLKELAGMSSSSDIGRMAEICMERKRYKCAEENYLRLAKKDPKILLRLGKLQMTRLQYKDAADTYHKFFASGGRDVEGSFSYAQALTQIGQVDEASRSYQMVLRMKTDAITHAAALHGIEKLQKTRAMMTASGILQPRKSQAPPKTAARGIASVPTVRQ